MNDQTLKWLYERFSQDHALRTDKSDRCYRACLEADRESSQALFASFTPEQNKLYLRYEEAHSALSALEYEQYFYQVFLFTRELLR